MARDLKQFEILGWAVFYAATYILFLLLTQLFFFVPVLKIFAGLFVFFLPFILASFVMMKVIYARRKFIPATLQIFWLSIVGSGLVSLLNVVFITFALSLVATGEGPELSTLLSLFEGEEFSSAEIAVVLGGFVGVWVASFAFTWLCMWLSAQFIERKRINTATLA